MNMALAPKQLVFAAIAAFSLANSAHAQSDNPDENRKYMSDAVNELADYLDLKCGNYKVTVKFDDSKFDYNSNPTNGTPTNADRVVAGLYAIASVCEGGDEASAKIKSTIRSIKIIPGNANIASITKGVLTLTYDIASTDPIGRLREQYYTQLK
jgi:hypothetical protein